jgi:hypothetical protein
MKKTLVVPLALALFGCGYKQVSQKMYLVTYTDAHVRSDFVRLVDAQLESMGLKGPGNEQPAFEQGEFINRHYFDGSFHVSLYDPASKIRTLKFGYLMLTQAAAFKRSSLGRLRLRLPT